MRRMSSTLHTPTRANQKAAIQAIAALSPVLQTERLIKVMDKINLHVALDWSSLDINNNKTNDNNNDNNNVNNDIGSVFVYTSLLTALINAGSLRRLDSDFLQELTAKCIQSVVVNLSKNITNTNNNSVKKSRMSASSDTESDSDRYIYMYVYVCNIYICV